MDSNTTYRQYLQYHANNHPSDVKRKEAQALLNVVGNDRNLNGNFLMGQTTTQNRVGGGRGADRTEYTRDVTTGENTSNGFVASTVNRTINPWWSSSYDDFLKLQQGETGGNTQNTGTGTGNTGLAYTPVRNDDARNLAYLEDQLRYMPGQLDRINQAQRNREGNIDNDYTLGLNQTNQAWNRAEQDHNLATDPFIDVRAFSSSAVLFLGGLLVPQRL